MHIAVNRHGEADFAVALQASDRDGDVMDGILSNNLLQLEPYGFTFIPPEPYSNNQKIFCPREALSEFHVLGVVGSPLTRRRRKEVPKEQIGLFEQE